MKKSTIWILGVVMGLSFLSLLYLQISYIEEMVKMRNGQFDESVKRALMAASKEAESAEVVRWLNEDISEAEKKAWEQSQSSSGVMRTQRFVMTAPDGSVRSSVELKTFSNEPSELPRAMISRKHGAKTIPQTSRSQIEMLKNRYLYQRALVDEVVLQMVYNASDKPIEERVNFKSLDQYLKAGLIENGLGDMDYHFKVIDREGREVYRCADYSDAGSESSYSQPLFLNDPPARMSIVKIHFPGKKDYIFDSVRFMIPSMIFTFVLLVTFIFTIYIVFRQKKLTEMKNDFINNMTHEFKTPISTISLAAQMLKDPAVGKSPTMFQHISGVINDETKRLRFQVEKVLQMSMFDRQKATLKNKELDANELIAGVINTFTLKVERYNGKIESELKATNSAIFADEMHITNVIFNLMDNAVKYKRPDADLQLTVKTWNEPGKLMISIQDNGIGIKKENLKKIFEKLQAKGYAAELYPDGEAGYKAFLKNKYDLCVFDVMMPKKDGFTLAQEVRAANAEIPIIFLTAKTLKEDILEGFKIGADDYITKPFSMEELTFRIEAILRRVRGKKNKESNIYKIGKFTFDTQKQILATAEKQTKLTTKESELLGLLCAHANEILQRDFALKTIWIDDNYFNARSMDVYITKLRKHLKEDDSIEIINIHGKGYKLITPEAES